jgi:hypothetical protein
MGGHGLGGRLCKAIPLLLSHSVPQHIPMAILENTMTTSSQQTSWMDTSKPAVEVTGEEHLPRSDNRQHEEGHSELYKNYIRSSAWDRRKVAYYAHHPKVCRACGSKEEIHLHHHTYARLTHEIDDDLVPLCKNCHELVHDYSRANPKWTLTKATGEFLMMASGSGLRKPKKRPKAQRPARKPVVKRPKKGQEIVPLRFKHAEGGHYKRRTPTPARTAADPVNRAMADAAGRRRSKTIQGISLPAVAQAFGVTTKQLRQQGFQKKVPVTTVAKWKDSPPSWMPTRELGS